MSAPDPLTDPRLFKWRRHLFRFGCWQMLFRFWMKVHVSGWENIPTGENVVMMGNHIGALDPVIMISFYPDRDIIPLAKVEAWDEPIQRFFVNHWGAIPINRGEADRKALKSALNHIESGRIVMLYAEGTRNKTGLGTPQGGSVYLAAKTHATIVPVAIWGTRDFPTSWFKGFFLPQVYIHFGRPFRFNQDGPKLPREHFPAMTEEAMYQIASILPEEWRGNYKDLTLASTNHLNFDFTWTPPKRRLPRRVLKGFDDAA